MNKPLMWDKWEFITDDNGVKCWEIDIADKLSKILKAWAGDTDPETLPITATVRKYSNTYNAAWIETGGDNPWEYAEFYRMKRYPHANFEKHHNSIILDIAESIWRQEYEAIGMEKPATKEQSYFLDFA